MAGESNGRKRTISLGFERPEKLNGDIIYVDFRYIDPDTAQIRQTRWISAIAYSNEKFTYHTPALAGNILTCSERFASTATGNGCHSWHLDDDKFVEDLVASNNGEVDPSRLIPDCSKIFISPF